MFLVAPSGNFLLLQATRIVEEIVVLNLIIDYFIARTLRARAAEWTLIYKGCPLEKIMEV
jgi:hypothetical protein